MKQSKFTDEQILAIVKEGEAGRKVADLCRAYRPEQIQRAPSVSTILSRSHRRTRASFAQIQLLQPAPARQ